MNESPIVESTQIYLWNVNRSKLLDSFSPHIIECQSQSSVELNFITPGKCQFQFGNAKMTWRRTTIAGKLYLSKCNVNSENKVEFHLCDFQTIWGESNHVDDVLIRGRELNKLIEYDNKTILDAITGIPKNLIVQQTTTGIELDFKYYIHNRPFNFKWNLKECKKSEFLDLIIKPLLLSVSILAKQNTDLKNIISKKDAEIEQYKLEGATLKRYKLATEPFDSKKFEEKFNYTPSQEFIEFANCKYDDFIRDHGNSSNLSSHSNVSANMASTSSSTAATTSVKSPRNKKNLRHPRLMQLHLEKLNEKVSFDDSESNTPPAVHDVLGIEESHGVELKRNSEERESTSSTVEQTSNKRLKFSRKKLNL